MRRILTAVLMIAGLFTVGPAQEQNTSQSREALAKLARAPSERDGIGRAVVFVGDANGGVVTGAYANLESTWGGDHYCESFGSTNDQGAIALLPIHMGQLKLVVKARGYRTASMEVDADNLSRPIFVTLERN